LTALTAPAGSGKTSLLSEWHADERERRSFAWTLEHSVPELKDDN
jgi:ATP/maltotriose-dependent transcriptional regulator MalT